MKLLQRRAVVSVTATVWLAVVTVALLGQYVVREHLWATETLEQIEPRYARLLGLRDSAEALDRALKQSRSTLERLGYGVKIDTAQAGNDLHQLVRRALETAGVSVSASQVLTPRVEAELERISVSVAAEGPLSAVQVALAALQAETPRIMFDNFVLQATGRAADDGAPIVSVRITAAVLRAQS